MLDETVRSESRDFHEWRQLARIGQVLLFTLLLACGAGGPQAGFKGANHPSVVNASQIKEVDQLPSDEVVIGEVVGVCSASNRSDVFGLASNHHCRNRDVVWKMKVSAAKAGGQSIIGRRCELDVDNSIDLSSHGYTSHTMECRANVARASQLVSDRNGVAGDPAAGRARDWPRAKILPKW